MFLQLRVNSLVVEFVGLFPLESIKRLIAENRQNSGVESFVLLSIDSQILLNVKQSRHGGFDSMESDTNMTGTRLNARTEGYTESQRSIDI
jgi:hypothetical protein